MKKAIAIVAMVLVVLAVGLVGVLVWGSWISPLERRAMRAALDRIDEVGKYQGNESVVYDQKLQAAKAAIVVCKKREITEYDKRLVLMLDIQLDGAVIEQKGRIKASTDPRYSR